jgi:flagellar protein FlaI
MPALRTLLPEPFSSDEDGACGCAVTLDGDTLQVDAAGCSNGGRLAESPACRATVVTALTRREVNRIRVVANGRERSYEDRAAALLVAAGRFVDKVADYDNRLATRTRHDPLGAAREATGRTGRVADIAARTGLAEVAARTPDDESAFAPVTGLSISNWRVRTEIQEGGTLVDARELDTGGTVRRYRWPDRRDRYVLAPIDGKLDASSCEILSAAYERIAQGKLEGNRRAPARAISDVTSADSPGANLASVLDKHTWGYGLLEDLFADERISDVFVSAPASDNPVRVRIDDRILPTNLRLVDDGVRALASRFRHESGNGFSAADPTIDTTVSIAGRRIRVAGVTDPVSEGTAFAFRAHDRRAWTLAALIANGTVTAEAGAVLSLAVERGRSVLVAGPRGAGKTTLLAALLWELPPAIRTVVIEDAPELPVGPLQEEGRDVQALRADGETGLTASEALRTALRLGNGALVVGEVRGEETSVLYEAMRVGANSEAVLGTIHGEGAAGVYNRVVSDLGVTPAAFDATDLVVTLELAEQASQPRRVRTIEEVVDAEAATFEPLFGRPDGTLTPNGCIDRGNSRLVSALARPGETYADVRDVIADRADWLQRLVERGMTTAGEVTAAQLERE